MSAFSDAAQQVTGDHSGGKPCSMAVVMDGLDAESRADLEEHLWGEDHWPDRKVAAVLTAMGLQVGYQPVGHHRRRCCRCFR